MQKNNRNDLTFWDDAFDDFFRPVFFKKNTEVMKTDIKELADSYEMDIEMPGFSKENIDLSLENGYLTVSACSNEKQESEDHKYLRRERSCSYKRSYYIGDYKKADVKAGYENGILKITLPKKQPEKAEDNKIYIE